MQPRRAHATPSSQIHIQVGQQGPLPRALHDSTRLVYNEGAGASSTKRVCVRQCPAFFVAQRDFGDDTDHVAVPQPRPSICATRAGMAQPFTRLASPCASLGAPRAALWSQAKGYGELITSLEKILCELTGFPGLLLLSPCCGLALGLPSCLAPPTLALILFKCPRRHFAPAQLRRHG